MNDEYKKIGRDGEGGGGGYGGGRFISFLPLVFLKSRTLKGRSSITDN